MYHLDGNDGFMLSKFMCVSQIHCGDQLIFSVKSMNHKSEFTNHQTQNQWFFTCWTLRF